MKTWWPPSPFGFSSSRMSFSAVISQLGSMPFPMSVSPETVERQRREKVWSPTIPGIRKRT